MVLLLLVVLIVVSLSLLKRLKTTYPPREGGKGTCSPGHGCTTWQY
jgi:hypothetical protein